MQAQAMPKTYWQVILRFGAAQTIKRITKAAQLAGMSRNQYIVRAAVEKAESDLGSAGGAE